MEIQTKALSVVITGVLAASSIANAAIFNSPILNLAIPVTPTGLYINFQTGVSGFNAGAVPGWDVNIGGSSSLNVISPGGYNFVRLNSASASAGASDLSAVPGPAFVINAYSMATASWITGGAATLTLNSAFNSIGFKFQDAANNWHLGWMQLSIGSSLTGDDRKLVMYSYNTDAISADPSPTAPGNSMTVPAPGAMALLCQAAFFARRRRS